MKVAKTHLGTDLGILKGGSFSENLLATPI